MTQQKLNSLKLMVFLKLSPLICRNTKDIHEIYEKGFC